MALEPQNSMNWGKILRAVALLGCLFFYGTVAVAYFLPTIVMNRAIRLGMYLTCFAVVVPSGVWLLVRLFRRGIRVSER